MNSPPPNDRPNESDLELTGLELELKRLRPMPIDSQTLDRVSAKLKACPEQRWLWPSVAAALAAACVLVALHTLKTHQPRPAPTAGIASDSRDLKNPTVSDDRDFSIASYQAAMDGPPSALAALLDRQAMRGGDQQEVTLVPTAAGALSQ